MAEQRDPLQGIGKKKKKSKIEAWEKACPSITLQTRLRKERILGLIRECEVLSSPFSGTPRIPVGFSQLDALENKSDASFQGP